MILSNGRVCCWTVARMSKRGSRTVGRRCISRPGMDTSRLLDYCSTTCAMMRAGLRCKRRQERDTWRLCNCYRGMLPAYRWRMYVILPIFTGHLVLMVLLKGRPVRTRTFGVDKVTTLSNWLIPRQLSLLRVHDEKIHAILQYKTFLRPEVFQLNLSSSSHDILFRLAQM